MNDKDKEAFDKWVMEGCDEDDCELILDYYISWQAACKYKQKEIDELLAENAKLRECVEWYETIGGKRARQVLKELEEK